MAYQLDVRPSVEHDLRPVPAAMVTRILNRMGALVDDPFPPQSEPLTGMARTYRLRVGDYRVIYTVDHDESLVTVHAVRNRRDAYRRR